MEISTTATNTYNLRSSNAGPQLSGNLLTETSERQFKRLFMSENGQESANSMNIEPNGMDDQASKISPTTAQDSAIMICYRECLSNMNKFNGENEHKITKFISNIERIGQMVNANDNILYCMGIAKLDGEAKRWYEDQTPATDWQQLKTALIERFKPSDSTSKIFEQLKERKQKPEEAINSYYDSIIKLCYEYDPIMSQKMKISWLENSIKDSLKIPIKRQMKLLTEDQRTTQAFLKIAKDEQELHEENRSSPEKISISHAPYFSNTVATTLQPTRNTLSTTDYRRPSRTVTSSQFQRSNRFQGDREPLRRQPSQIPYPSTRERSQSPGPQQRSYSPRPQQRNTSDNTTELSTRPSARLRNACLICGRTNHRTIDCYERKPNGCYKCGQSDHRVRDCPEVFY